MGKLDNLLGKLKFNKKKQNKSFDAVSYMKKELNSSQKNQEMGPPPGSNSAGVQGQKGPSPSTPELQNAQNLGGSSSSMDLPPPPSLSQPPAPDSSTQPVSQSIEPGEGIKSDDSHTPSTFPSDIDHQDFSVKSKPQSNDASSDSQTEQMSSEKGSETSQQASFTSSFEAQAQNPVQQGTPFGSMPAMPDNSPNTMQNASLNNNQVSQNPGAKNADSENQSKSDPLLSSDDNEKNTSQTVPQKNEQETILEEQNQRDSQVRSPEESKTPSAATDSLNQSNFPARNSYASQTSRENTAQNRTSESDTKGKTTQTQEEFFSGKGFSDKQNFSAKSYESSEEDSNNTHPDLNNSKEKEDDFSTKKFFITVADLRSLVETSSSIDSEIEVSLDSTSKTNEMCQDTDNLFEELKGHMESVQNLIDDFDKVMFKN
ncbi:MAG: hypothetical protein ACQESF_00325 [Nanobdellota archaeon]